MSCGISQEAVISNVKFVHSPFTLSLIATPPYIKPSLPYNIRVLVKDPLGESVRGVRVKARAIVTNNNNEQEYLKFQGHQNEITQTSTNDGIAYFVCNIPHNAERAEFTFETDDYKYPPVSQAQLKLSTVAYKSVNKRYLYISLPSHASAFEVDDYASININFYYRDYLPLKTFSYQIISKGKVVKFATVERVTDTVQSINFKVTSNMVPSARLLVYYILSGEQRAELVADSVWFNVKARCVNNLEVNLAAQGKDYKPKDKLTLSVKTKSANEKSLVALSAVDTALYNLRANDKDPLNKVLQQFEHSDLGCGGGGGRNNADVFSRTGLTFLTNANVEAFNTDDTCTAVVRSKRSTLSVTEMQEYANKYNQYKPCCLEGMNTRLALDTCLSATKKFLTPYKQCKKAFLECCNFAEKHQQENGGPVLPHSPAFTFGTPSPAVPTERSNLSLNERFEEYAKKYDDYKSCCLQGTNSSLSLESCWDRSSKLQNNDELCKIAFHECCIFAERHRKEDESMLTLGHSGILCLLGIRKTLVPGL
ncbi:hypothetical protein PDJAM_G00145660 [Pangasius djambal]|uniref:Uncharacterized protein n=1 Tax=Pangasius djambal TaxID=1691987 RepID=A0ACC5ZFH4_9TELE|nr:hypothetical protein [Pangasius djambal]